LVVIIFTSFAIFLKEKGERPIEEVLESTNRMIDSILGAWGIRS
jgi:hypothetical protein